MAHRVHSEKGSQKITIRIRRPSAEFFPRFCRSFGRILVLLSLLIVPVLYSSEISYSGEFPKFIAMLTIAFSLGTLFILATMSSPTHRFTQSTILALIILFLLGYIISAIFSAHPVASIFGNRGTWSTGILGITSACVIAIVTSNFFKSKTSAYHILVYLSLSGFFTSLLFLSAQYLLPLLNIDNILSFLPIPNTSHLSGFLLITLAANIAISLDPLAKHIRPALLFVVATQTAALISAGSPVSIVIGSISIIPLAISIFARRIKTRKRGQSLFFILILISSVLTAIILLPVTRSLLPNTIRSHSYVESIYETVYSWKPGLQIFSEHILTGTGPELLNTALLKVSKTFAQTHLSGGLVNYSFSNEFVTLLATSGLVGSIPFITLVLYLFSILFRRTKLTFESQAFLYVSLVFLTSLFVHPFSALTLFAGFTVLGLGAAHIPPVAYTSKEHTPSPWHHYLIICVILVYAGYGLFSLARAEHLYMRSTVQNSPQNMQSAAEAITLNPYDAAYHRAYTAYLIQFARNSSTTENLPEISRQIRQSNDATLSINPYDYLNLYTAAQAYTDLAEILDYPPYKTTAISYISSAIEISPYDQRLRLFRGSQFLLLGNSESATKDFNRAISIDPNLWYTYLTIAQLLQDAGKYQQSVAYLEKVIRNSPNIQYIQKAQSMLEAVPITIEK